jgi:hypothetical protein
MSNTLFKLLPSVRVFGNAVLIPFRSAPVDR